jgi:peptide/nickel transport system permease protein
MLAVRHPFIRKRILLMVPMLAVISVMVFVIIQLPPGDYTTVRIAQLEEQGDQVQIKEIEEIRETFHLDKPVVVRYVNWMGFRWFMSYEGKDQGLLQGHLGLSMKDNMPVNKLVGDRLLLTFLITLGSVMLTWMIALPIGIYSAVKQYSVGDYFFTSVAFLGMCTPTFLLALVLMVITGVTGLFSPEFAAMEGWDWPKVLDLMKHIWLPVVIVGVASTAGMIRVMRANLLDELKKPYVTTARAKGMRPIRLLLKYPVRIALNPFVSGIGSLFPALVSGSAIIAMVLGLPTVGPLLLNSVLDQDMYLAGSMLMVMGLLSIFGTLVSDLLLVWLDPRIRYDK